MKKSLFILLTAFNIGVQAQTVKVAAAADMKYIMPELVAIYQKTHPTSKIEVNYGSSGLFFQQISNGAPYDLYFSADISYPQKLADQGIAKGKVTTYAFGALVLYSTSIDVSKGIGAIKNADKIAIANPQHAPYGKRAEECLKYYGLYESSKSKFVLGDNINQTAQFVVTGNADAALIALSIAVSPELNSKGKYVRLDSKSYKPLEQACVLLKSWQANPEASKFMKFVLSPECRPIFEKYGFIVP